jgi:hypothetical protein
MHHTKIESKAASKKDKVNPEWVKEQICERHDQVAQRNPLKNSHDSPAFERRCCKDTRDPALEI